MPLLIDGKKPEFDVKAKELARSNPSDPAGNFMKGGKDLGIFKEELDEGVLDSADFKVNAAGKRYRAHKVYVGRDKFQRQATVDKEIEITKPSKITEEPLILKDPPNVLFLKIITVRGFPDGTKVALYYNKLLDKHFTIPYGPGVDAPLQSEESEMSVMESLEYLSRLTESSAYSINFETDTRSVTPQMARNILKLYGSLSEENKNKMEQNLNDPIMFDKFHDYSLKI